MAMHDPLIYIHIPKTAGTSFRVSAEKYFGETNVLRDYGADSASTSADIIDSFYDTEDLSALRERGLSKKFLCGHFSLPRYREVFPDSPVMTFFRNPIKRVVSEFVHFTNHHDYTGTLEDFYNNPRFQNRQHHSLGGAMPTELDFYGLTEQFDKSLQMFNKRYGTTLHATNLNKGSYGPSSIVKPTARQIQEIAHLNQADMAVYAQAEKMFEQQSEQSRSARFIGTRYRGNFGGLWNDKLIGWISDTKSGQPVRLRISVNGVYITTLLADKKRPDLVRNGLHDDGYCGFEIPVSDLGLVSHHDSISIATEDGLFELPNSPLVIAA